VVALGTTAEALQVSVAPAVQGLVVGATAPTFRC